MEWVNSRSRSGKIEKTTPQELIDELNSCKEKIKNLEEQNGQLMAQIEVKETKKWPWLKVRK